MDIYNWFTFEITDFQYTVIVLMSICSFSDDELHFIALAESFTTHIIESDILPYYIMLFFKGWPKQIFIFQYTFIWLDQLSWIWVVIFEYKECTSCTINQSTGTLPAVYFVEYYFQPTCGSGGHESTWGTTCWFFCCGCFHCREVRGRNNLIIKVSIFQFKKRTTVSVAHFQYQCNFTICLLRAQVCSDLKDFVFAPKNLILPMV